MKYEERGTRNEGVLGHWRCGPGWRFREERTKYEGESTRDEGLGHWKFGPGWRIREERKMHKGESTRDEARLPAVMGERRRRDACKAIMQSG